MDAMQIARRFRGCRRPLVRRAIGSGHRSAGLIGGQLVIAAVRTTRPGMCRSNRLINIAARTQCLLGKVSPARTTTSPMGGGIF